MTSGKLVRLTVATDRRVRPEGCEEVTAGKLGEMRGMLRDRVALKGPWWTA